MPTLTADPIEILIASDAWGTRAILGLCEKLTHEQFHQRFPIGLGTLHETITHILSATRRWTDRLADRTPRAMLHAVPEFPHVGGETKDRTPIELIALLNDAESDLKAVMKRIVAEGRLGTTIQLEWPSDEGVKIYTFSRGAVLVHLTTHGYHHRAQCLNMLRHLNVAGISDKLPEPSAVDWQVECESPAVLKKS